MASSISPASTARPPAATDGAPATHRHEPLIAHWRRHLPRYAGELIGTFVLVVVATGVVVANVAADEAITHVGVAIATGLVITALIYALGHLTGAHFNPAVSLAFAVGRHFPARDLVPYWLAQLAGAALASVFVRYLWGDIANLGATLPGVSEGRALVLEVFLTFLLMFVITAVATDARAVGQAAALAIGSVVLLEVMFAGPASGASMNPARSFGPALVSGTWESQWIYYAGPLLGAVGGVLVYEFLRRAEKV
ncbi:MAG: aquaporin [Dehalococcoidia bacterium]